LTNAEFAVSEDQQLRTTGPPSPAIVIWITASASPERPAAEQTTLRADAAEWSFSKNLEINRLRLQCFMATSYSIEKNLHLSSIIRQLRNHFELLSWYGKSLMFPSEFI
jgi:hypothetical protein